MPLISQSQFPRTWLTFQRLFGGTPEKQRVALERYRGQPRILEVGCSVGNLTPPFLLFPGSMYTGLDIDAMAIDFARHRFARHPNARFLRLPLGDLVLCKERFDYVLFAGILHHVDDPTALQLLQYGLALLAPQGRMVVSEPEALRPADNVLIKLFYCLEQGRHLRSADALARLIESAGARIIFRGNRLIGPGIATRPKVARFTLIEALSLAPTTR